jgi:UPF0755 protein
MREFLSLSASFLALLIILGFGGLYEGARLYKGPGPLAAETMHVVPRGAGVGAIAKDLAQAGVIGDAFAFRAVVRLSGKSKTLKAGEYDFPAHVSLKDVIDKMAAGDVYHRSFTVPEGYTSRQIVKLLQAVPELNGDAPPVPAEGALLPETYDFTRGDLRADKIAQMQAAMTQALDELWAQRDPASPFRSPAEAVTLASIVEKETGVASERPRIAGVFLNRLRLGMKLQSDPTVIYALTKGDIKDEGQGPLGRRLLKKDLEIDSPYNTYLYAGLPPGPIANPGRAALQAVLMPEHNDFLYFVADGTGGHVFARSIAEHEHNVLLWRKIRKEEDKK